MTRQTKAKSVETGALARALDWVVSVDVPVARNRVAALRRARVGAADGLAAHLYDNLAWKAAGIGFLSGLPNHPLAALPAAGGEALWLLRQQIQTAGEAALLLDPHFFDHPDAGWVLLVPVLGVSTLSQALRTAGISAGKTMARRLIVRKLRGAALRRFKRMVVKVFGKKITRRALLTKTIPLVGALVGGAWNFGEVKLQKRRVLSFFADRP